MTTVVTVEIPTDNRIHARQMLENFGFTVTRVALKRATSTVSSADPNLRASAVLDMPEGLDAQERDAYVRGYGKGAAAYTKKHGTPSGCGIPEPKPTPLPIRVEPTREEVDTWLKLEWAAIKQNTRQTEWDRHPGCHKAGMAALRKWQAHWAEYAEASPSYRRAQIREVNAA